MPEAHTAASNLAGVFKRMGQLDDALTKIRAVCEASARDGDDEAEQMALANEATLLWEMAAPIGDRYRLEEAWDRAQKSRQICERHSWNERLAFVLGTCGLIARFLDRWDDARDCFELQVGVARETGDADQLGRALLNFASFNIETEDYRRATELVAELARIVDRMKDPDMRMSATALLKQLGLVNADWQ